MPALQRIWGYPFAELHSGAVELRQEQSVECGPFKVARLGEELVSNDLPETVAAEEFDRHWLCQVVERQKSPGSGRSNAGRVRSDSATREDELRVIQLPAFLAPSRA
jgi:hypothetical protein